MITDYPHIRNLEERLFEKELDLEVLKQYHTAVIQSGQLVQAHLLYKKLLQHHPLNITLESFYVALCLEQNRHHDALDAVRHLLSHAKPDDDLLNAALAVHRRVEPAGSKQKKNSPISLCMIVRNEAGQLGRCLYHLKELVGQMIVVDTGSTDRSKDLASLFEAQVYDFQWCEDFSKARNFSLSKASGQWILVLDADEAISGSDFNTLRAMIGQSANEQAAFAVTTRNYCNIANAVGWQPNDGVYPDQEAGIGWFPSTKVRLFRNDSLIRFHFPVHERVEPSIRSIGGKILKCSVPVHHYGHLDESLNLRKARAYYQLGVSKLDGMADDWQAIRELAVQAGQLDRRQEAIELWQRLLNIEPDCAEAMINLAGLFWNGSDYEQSLVWAQRALKKDGSLQEAKYNLAVSYLMLGRYQEAISILELLIGANPGYMAGSFMLAATYAGLGDIERSMAVYHKLSSGVAAKAIPIALNDLIQRMKKNGQNKTVENIEIAFKTAMCKQPA